MESRPPTISEQIQALERASFLLRPRPAIPRVTSKRAYRFRKGKLVRVNEGCK